MSSPFFQCEKTKFKGCDIILLLSPFHTPQRRSTSKPDPTSNWQPPKLFKTRDYFSSSGSATSPGHTATAGGQARALETAEDNR